MSMLIAFLLSWFFHSQNTTHTAPSSQFIVEVTQEQYPRLAVALGDISYDLKRIHSSGDYYRLHVTEEFNSERLNAFRDLGFLIRWQHDRPLTQRSNPNDPLFANQWGMMRIDMPEAWDQTTGGVTIEGDPIVVAILDVGFDINHEDLQQNIWVNPGEIPGDGIDNDQNGYVDDYRGLNVRTEDDDHPNNTHGTSVAGIIGAHGNNGKGICGVNWNVKLLFISGVLNESDIIEGYMYSVALREKYRQSNGTQGAFVVATNLSAGIDNGQPADHQLWCDQYEAMGNAGILGVCATTNTNSDVDVHGDMPTTCLSEYLVAVTNTDMNDNKLLFAGYGDTHIDLAAPGSPTLTTDIFNNYENFEGTSASAPHISGAIALLYASACSDVLSLTSSNPGALALQMKTLILQSTDQIASLSAFTASGGRLNVARAIGAMVDICNIAGGELEIIRMTPNPAFDETLIEFNIPDLNPYDISIYDSAGRLLLHVEQAVTIPGYQTYLLPVNNYVTGIYYVSIEHRDELVSAALFVR